MASTGPRLGPMLRSDLVIVEKVRQGERMLVVKDPITMKYYSFGALERTLLRLMDGSNPPQKILDEFNTDHPDAGMDMDGLKEFLGDIDKMHLLEKSAAEKNELMLDRLKEERKSKLMSKQGSVLYKRFPVVDPNEFFDIVHPYIRWMWSIPCVIFICLVVLTAGVLVAYNWDEFAEGIKAVFTFSSYTPTSIFWLWVTIIGIIAVHELGHGLTCKHFGGEVHEIGFLIMFFQPCLYCNVTDAYMFTNKWHKIYVTFAGILIEFFIGSIFCFIWLLSDPTTAINAICYQAMTVCGISSVLFNLNPLFKYDGYYALSEYLDLPNLKQNSGDYLEKWFRRIYQKPEDVEEDDYSERERRIYVIYGLLASVYILMMLSGLLYMIKDVFMEAWPEGGVVAYCFVVYKLMNGQINAVKDFFVDFFKYEKAAMGGVRTSLILSAVVALVLGLGFTLPYDIVIEKPVTLEAADRWTARAAVEGFLEETYVKNGDVVQAGQPLVLIANPDKSRKLSDLASQSQQYQMQRDEALAGGDYARLNDISVREQQTAREHAAIRRDLDKMRTLSPAAGVVMTEHVEELKGKHCTVGEKMIEIVSLENLYSVVELDERAAGDVRDRRAAGDNATRARIKVNAMPGRVFEGRVLAVDVIADTSGVTRKFRAKIAIPNPDIRPGASPLEMLALRPGMTGVARLDVARGTPVQAAGRWLAGFFRLDLFMY